MARFDRNDALVVSVSQSCWAQYGKPLRRMMSFGETDWLPRKLSLRLSTPKAALHSANYPNQFMLQDHNSTPYLPPKAEPALNAAGPWWRQRGYAFVLTLVFIAVPACLYTALFNVPLSDKPIFLARMLLGPFGRLLEATPRLDWMSVCIVSPFVCCYTAYPCCLTFIATCVGVFFWWACGVVVATGI